MKGRILDTEKGIGGVSDEDTLGLLPYKRRSYRLCRRLSCFRVSGIIGSSVGIDGSCGISTRLRIGQYNRVKKVRAGPKLSPFAE